MSGQEHVHLAQQVDVSWFIFCSCKPHPFGNEYHRAYCGICNILFSIKMVQGKDAPPQLDIPFSPHGKMVGLLLRMLKSYFHTGKYIVLDLGFCVLKRESSSFGRWGRLRACLSKNIRADMSVSPEMQFR